jgi:hypothetical protein
VLFAYYTKDDQSKWDDIDGACGTNGRGEKCLQDFGGKDRRKETTRRLRRRWLDNIKMNLREIG